MAETELQPSRTAVDLNGDWERWVHGKVVDVITVPCSLHPSGLYRLRRSFLLPKLTNGNRAILHFNAINYHGRVFVNGKELAPRFLSSPMNSSSPVRPVEGRIRWRCRSRTRFLNLTALARTRSNSPLRVVGSPTAESFAMFMQMSVRGHSSTMYVSDIS